MPNYSKSTSKGALKHKISTFEGAYFILSNKSGREQRADIRESIVEIKGGLLIFHLLLIGSHRSRSSFIERISLALAVVEQDLAQREHKAF